ncbi:hypothetical protein L1049_012909 [Liquidambar formosana]|uniref:DUF3527 domain protein n=1 Tax=Liquidambar formosana TaxID=63359 RepID=A0AAP0RJD4_LIQFO
MEYHLELKKNSWDPQASGTVEKIISPGGRQSVKLLDRFKSEKPSLSYADFHHEITKSSDDLPPKPSGTHHKQQIGRRATEDDELVKYMSNLPSYLERGKNLQEKAFNVGVLDWGRLEKWQHNHKKVPYRSGTYSPSSSNTSSVFSTDESSTLSSRGHSCSPARQRVHRPTLQSHLKASPQEGYSQAVKPLGGNAGKFQDLKAAQSNTLSKQQKFLKPDQPFRKNQSGYSQAVKPFRGNSGKFQDIKAAQSNTLNGQPKFLETDQPFCKNQSQVKLEQCMIEDSTPKIIPEMRASSNLENYKVASCSKEKMKTKDGEFSKEVRESDTLNSDDAEQDCPERLKTVVLLLPRDDPQKSSSGVFQLSGSTTMTDQRSMEASYRCSTARSYPREVHHAKFYSDIPHSCPLPCEVDNSEHRQQMKQPSSMDDQSIDFTSDASCPLQRSGKTFVSPFRGRNSEEKKSTLLPTNSTVIKPSEGSSPNTSTVAAAKVRNPSPIRRFSVDLGRLSRISGSKESSAVPQLSSTHVSAKSDSERDVAPACLDKSSSDKPNATSKARSSPLRRLLDPLLKPKTANCRRSAEPPQKDSTSINRSCKSFDGQSDSSLQKDSRSINRAFKSFDGQSDSSNEHSVKVKLDLTSCRSISVDDSCQNGKHGSSSVQALLRVAVKNGLPLFTFAVDNNRDILAATVRKLSTSRKDDNNCLYTFFTIREIKKKSWINHGGKGKGRDYVPNVVAQMKVSDSQFSNLNRPCSMDKFCVREFVLLADQQMTGFQSNDELAAIVMKIPKETTGSLIQDRKQTDHCSNSSDIDFKEWLAEMRHSYSGENLQNQSLVGSPDHCNTTVILPSGVHSQPNNGEPSSLIKRWVSGGVCDCGGWDLGCNLRVLGSQNQLNKRLSPFEACSTTNQFQLCSQGGVQDNQVVFSLAPFKDGIYSVEFNSSLTLLQAFSISVAALDSKKRSEHSEPINFFQGKTSQETILVENDGPKVANQVQAEVPPRYVSYPPLSPVGRV